jgi:DNA-binding PadR family transcriptional regulator
MTPVFRHGRLRLYLLRLLDEEPRHGYEVIRLLRDRFMGVYAPSPGTIYPRLSRLEDEGLVTHDEESGRKVYRITEAGREELRSRGAELDELEEELSESVSDIAREFGEDVRATVRSLREELTRAAREVRQTERDTAREAAEAAREQARESREQAKQTRDQAKESAWTQARQARERARQARDEAFGHAQRLRDEATQLRDDAREQFGGWGNWSEWSHGTDKPGRGAPDLAALRDFERLARDFVSDLRSVAWDSSNILGSEVIPVLRDIFADTLERIRTEVLGTLNTSAPSDTPPADDSDSSGSSGS